MPSKDFAKGTKGMKRAAEAVVEETPAPKLGKRAPVLLEDLDLSKIDLGPKVDEGKNDHFMRVFYDGQRLEIALAKLPNYCRAPFAAGPAKDKNGNLFGDNPDPPWGMAAELTDAQYKKFNDLERRSLPS